MKRSKGKGSAKVRFTNLFLGSGELRRDFHSTPDLAAAAHAHQQQMPKGHRSQEDVTLLLTNRTLPPNHPPPPPPTTVQVVKLEVRAGAEYDTLANKKQEGKICNSGVWLGMLN